MPIAIHFAHRIGALVAIALGADRRRRARLDPSRRRRELVRPVWLLVLRSRRRSTLGALVVLTGKQPLINTLHVATGAIVLGTSLVLTLRAYRVRFGSASPGVAAGRRAPGRAAPRHR